MWTKGFQGALHRGHSGEMVGAKVGVSHGTLGCSAQEASWKDGWR